MALAVVLAALEKALGGPAPALAAAAPLLPLFAASDRELLACRAALGS